VDIASKQSRSGGNGGFDEVDSFQEVMLRQKRFISISVTLSGLFALNGQQIPAQGKLVFERRPGARSKEIGVP